MMQDREGLNVEVQMEEVKRGFPNVVLSVTATPLARQRFLRQRDHSHAVVCQ